jgi:hypothetical protein
MIDRLEYQARNEKSNPNKADEKLIDPDTMGPMTIAAKSTCPMSRKISESIFDFSKEDSICVYYINSEKSVKENKNPRHDV